MSLIGFVNLMLLFIVRYPLFSKRIKRRLAIPEVNFASLANSGTVSSGLLLNVLAKRIRMIVFNFSGISILPQTKDNLLVYKVYFSLNICTLIYIVRP